MKKDKLIISNKKFNSRLIVGTGKYKNMKECAKAIKASEADIVTVAVRRVNIFDKKKPLLMDYIDPKKITYLPNTAGCFNSEDALRTLRLAREIGGWKLVKLEVLGDKKNLFPEMIETLKSTEVLTKEGFKVMVYCNDDPLMAKRLENVGASAIMPLAAPIGSGLGILNKINVQITKSSQGSDPASVAYKAVEEAINNNFQQVLIDTAGRLQNKKNLMEEYKKIANVTKKIDPDAPHNVILVLDATSGQNVINQVEEFNKIIPITGIVMTKLDGTAKGGILLALAKKYKLPILALGLGEKEDDLQLFDAKQFAEAFTQIN